MASHLVRFSYSKRSRAFLFTSSYSSKTGSSTSFRLGWAMGTTCGEDQAGDVGGAGDVDVAGDVGKTEDVGEETDMHEW